MPRVYVEESALFVTSIRDDKTTPAPGAREALRRLADGGCGLAIVRHAGAGAAGEEATREAAAQLRDLGLPVVSTVPDDERDGWLIVSTPEAGESRGKHVRTILVGPAPQHRPGPMHRTDVEAATWSSVALAILTSEAMPEPAAPGALAASQDGARDGEIASDGIG